MVNLYFGVDLFYTPPEHKEMMQKLKGEIQKWRCYQILGEILVPITGDFSEVSWYNKDRYEHFIQSAQVLIVDTTHTPPVHQKLKTFLRENKILLVECSRNPNPRMYPDLNSTETIAYSITLEYQTSIMEVIGYILTKICMHHTSLHLVSYTKHLKPLLI